MPLIKEKETEPKYLTKQNKQMLFLFKYVWAELSIG